MNPDLLDEAAQLAGLQIPRAERDVLVGKMSRILAFMDQIGNFSPVSADRSCCTQSFLRGDEPGEGSLIMDPPSGLEHGFLLVPRPFEPEDQG